MTNFKVGWSGKFYGNRKIKLHLAHFKDIGMVSEKLYWKNLKASIKICYL